MASEEPGPSSRVRRAAPSLHVQPNAPALSSHGAAKTPLRPCCGARRGGDARVHEVQPVGRVRQRDLRDEVAPSLRNRFAGLVPEVYKAPAAHLAMVRVGLRLRARVRDGVGVRVRVTSMPFATAYCCERQACLGLGLGQVRASPNREPSPNPMLAPGVCSPDCSGGLLLLARRRRAARRACEGRPVST